MSTTTDNDALPKVMGDDGQFHATDAAVDLSHTTFEGWVSLLIFWALGLVTSYTLSGFIHILLVAAVVVILVRVIQGRRPI
jgi:hypothetical protein